MNIAIIGCGVYGLAMANSLSMNKKNKIKMWTESDESLKNLEDNRKKYEPLGGLELPKDIVFSTCYEEVLDGADIVFIMSAARFVGSVCKEMKQFINDNMHFVIGSKGIEQESCRFVHEVFLNTIKTKKLAVISGPSFAIDIAHGEPIALAVGTKSTPTFDLMQKIYKGSNIKLRKSNDLLGIELCGSIKNVIAVAAGILEGLGYQESTRAFLITESLHDIKELMHGLGGKRKTILTYAGVGDLLLTATSTKSRNYSYGVYLGKKDFEGAKKYLDNTTVEGYYTLKSIYALLRKKKIKMPIVDLIYKIVMKDDDPNKLAQFLMEKK